MPEFEYHPMPQSPVSSPNSSGQPAATTSTIRQHSFFGGCPLVRSSCASAVDATRARIASIALFVNKRRVELLYAYIYFQLLIDFLTTALAYFVANGHGQSVNVNCTNSFTNQGKVKGPVSKYYYLPGASLSITALIYMRKLQQRFNILPSFFPRITILNNYGQRVPLPSIYSFLFVFNDVLLVGLNAYFFTVLYLRSNFTQRACIRNPSGNRLNPFFTFDRELCLKDGEIDLNLQDCQQAFCQLLTGSAYDDFFLAATFMVIRFVLSTLNCLSTYSHARSLTGNNHVVTMLPGA